MSDNVLISTSNHMFGRAIWDKLPECIFENFEIKREHFQISKNHEGDLSQISPEANIWLLVNHTKPSNTLYLNEYLLIAGNYKSAGGQFKNNSIDGTILITINRVITTLNNSFNFLDVMI